MNFKYFGLENLSEADMEQLLIEQIAYERQLQLQEQLQEQKQLQEQPKQQKKIVQKRKYMSELFFGLTKNGDVDFKFSIDDAADTHQKYPEYIAMMFNDIVSGNFNDTIIQYLIAQSQQSETHNSVITKIMNSWQDIYKKKSIIKPSQVFKQYLGAEK